MEWPSEKKLQRLRGEGRVPCSYFGSSCLLLALFILLIPDFSVLWGSLLEVWLKAWHSPAASGWALLQEDEAISDLAWIFAAPALLVLGVLFAVGLAQTKFLFEPKLVSFDLSRLLAVREDKHGVGLMAALTVCFLALSTGIGVLGLALPALLVLFGLKSLKVSSWVESFVSELTPALLMALGVSALVGIVAVRLLFLFKHRMSREELEKEDLSAE
ncbi:MAG: hypothetical protein GX589_06945 [Deltaproteobacteria bacterium]|nr:hypothetical protein [Deltaproteobacteria bacterium]